MRAGLRSKIAICLAGASIALAVALGHIPGIQAEGRAGNPGDHDILDFEMTALEVAIRFRDLDVPLDLADIPRTLRVQSGGALQALIKEAPVSFFKKDAPTCERGENKQLIEPAGKIIACVTPWQRELKAGVAVLPGVHEESWLKQHPVDRPRIFVQYDFWSKLNLTQKREWALFAYGDSYFRQNIYWGPDKNKYQGLSTVQSIAKALYTHADKPAPRLNCGKMDLDQEAALKRTFVQRAENMLSVIDLYDAQPYPTPEERQHFSDRFREAIKNTRINVSDNQPDFILPGDWKPVSAINRIEAGQWVIHLNYCAWMSRSVMSQHALALHEYLPQLLGQPDKELKIMNAILFKIASFRVTLSLTEEP